MVLSVVHDDLNDRVVIAIFCRAWLVLEGIGATQCVTEDAERTVQLSSYGGEAVFCIIAAGEGIHGIGRQTSVGILVAAIDDIRLIATDSTRGRGTLRLLAVRLCEADIELMVVVDVPVHTCKDAVGWCLDMISLPGSRRQAIGLLQIIREAFQFVELRTAVCRGIGNAAVAST